MLEKAQKYFSGAGKVAAAVLSGRLQYLILHVTSVCNARCQFCFNWNGMQSRRSIAPISMSQYEKLACSVGKLPQLTFSGGEPLLRSDLLEVIDLFYLKAGTRYFTVPSNGLSPDRAKRLCAGFRERSPKGFLNLCLPFHGTKDSFEEIVGVPGGFERHRRTYETLVEEQEKSPNISIVLNLVLNSLNCRDYQKIIDLAFAQYPDAPLVLSLTRGVPRNPEVSEVPVELYGEASGYLWKKKMGVRRRNPFNLMFDAIGIQVYETVSRVAGGEMPDLKCRAGKGILVIYDDGTVYPCEMLDVLWGDHSVLGSRSSCLGDLGAFDFDLQALLRSEQARKTVDWIENHACACSWECAIYNRIMNSPTELIRLGAKVGATLGRSFG